MILKFFGWFSKKISRKNMYEFMNAELRKIVPDGKILNIGAGGEIMRHISEACAPKRIRVVSFDISSDRNPDILGDVCEMNFRCEFDAIVMAEVLEHVRHPQRACQNVYDALRPGGRLILTTPFIFPIHDRPHDYWRFTRYGLECLLQEAGFLAPALKERNGWGEAITVLLSRPVHTPGHSLIAKCISGILALCFFPIGKLLSVLWPHDFLTTGYDVTAVKPI